VTAEESILPKRCLVSRYQTSLWCAARSPDLYELAHVQASIVAGLDLNHPQYGGRIMLYFSCVAELHRGWVLALRPAEQYRASQIAYPVRKVLQSSATGSLGQAATSPILYEPAHVQESAVAGPAPPDIHRGRMAVL